MPAFYNRTLTDYNGEKTTFRIQTAEINAGNIGDQVIASANLGAAINDMTLGSLYRLSYGNETVAAEESPANTWAQRELKWLVSYADSVTGKLFRVELGTADTSLLDPNARGQADMDNVNVAAFVTAFEAYAVAPDTGNAVEVRSITLVGRNI